MYCPNCGNSVDDNAVICPKCGVPIQSRKNVIQQDKTNVLAIVGFVFSFFVALVGLICSIMGRKQCRETGEKGMGLATAGMIISIVGLSLSVIYFLIFIITLAAL